MTNSEFAKSDPVFIHSCTLAGIEPSPRQASKWRLKRGAAYKASHGQKVTVKVHISKKAKA